jgi:tRNA(fMet)-specific endonuclease VapC
MRRYMLDTTTASYALEGHQLVRRKMNSVPLPSLCVSALTQGELLEGIAELEESPKRAALAAAVREFFSNQVEILAWDSNAAEAFASLLARRVKQHGRQEAEDHIMDLIIAAHSIAISATLVAADSWFARLEPKLRLENWTKA